MKMFRFVCVAAVLGLIGCTGFKSIDSLQKNVQFEPDRVFGGDDRSPMTQTSYPWSAVGRLGPSGCTGTVIGPRHVLTAAHCIPWNIEWAESQIPSFCRDQAYDGNRCGEAIIATGRARAMTGGHTFAPLYNRGESQFGSAQATEVIFLNDNPYRFIFFINGVEPIYMSKGISNSEMAQDLAVVVLDREIGNDTGWMGTKRYNEEWNNKGYWTNVGYPSDRDSNQVAYYSKGCAVDSVQNGQVIRSKCDIYPGHSGGPFFGGWGSLPYIVGVTSAESSEYNSFVTGENLITIVQDALNRTGYGHLTEASGSRPGAPSGSGSGGQEPPPPQQTPPPAATPPPKAGGVSARVVGWHHDGSDDVANASTSSHIDVVNDGSVSFSNYQVTCRAREYSAGTVDLIGVAGGPSTWRPGEGFQLRLTVVPRPHAGRTDEYRLYQYTCSISVDGRELSSSSDMNFWVRNP